MKIYYTSLTGKTEKFVKSVSSDYELLTPDTVVSEPFVLVVYTFNFGDIPNGVRDFLENNKNYEFLKGVASSGHIVWGDNFGKAADKLSELYDVPVLLKFHQFGTAEDRETFIKKLGVLDDECSRKHC